MLWDIIAPAWVARLEADSALVTALGGLHIYPAQASRPVKVPSVEYLFDSDQIRESFSEMGLTVDVYARGMASAAVIEKRIREMTHRDIAQSLGGRQIWMRYVDSRTLEFPSDPGVMHRALDFEVEAVRHKYD